MALAALVPLHLDLTLPAHITLRLKQKPKHQPLHCRCDMRAVGTLPQGQLELSLFPELQANWPGPVVRPPQQRCPIRLCEPHAFRCKKQSFTGVPSSHRGFKLVPGGAAQQPQAFGQL